LNRFTDRESRVSEIDISAGSQLTILRRFRAVSCRCDKHYREHIYRNLRGWEIWLEFVLVREGCESVEADSSGHDGGGGSGAALNACGGNAATDAHGKPEHAKSRESLEGNGTRNHLNPSGI